MSDSVEQTPALLVVPRARGESPAPQPAAGPAVGAVERPVLALPAGGATTARATRELGLSGDGVTYHLRRLSARWDASNRTELVRPRPRLRRPHTGSTAPGDAEPAGTE